MHRSTLGRLALAACVLVVAVLVLAGRSSDPPPDVRSPAAPPIARSPGGAPPAGTMILVHGGSWRGPDSREQARLVRDPGELLLKRRWRIVSVDYARGKAGLRDLLSAVERERPPRGGSPLCLYGESAGGHLSLVAAARQPFVDCVIAAAPPTDFQAYFATATAGTNGVHRAVAGIIRRTFGQSPAATAPWEPVRLARRIEAEVLLLRVSNDPLVPRAQMERFVAARPSTRFVELEEGDLADPAQAWVHGALSARGRRVLRSRLARFVDCAARQRAPTRGRQCQ